MTSPVLGMAARPDSGGDDSPDLSSMTKAQLLDYAEGEGIEGLTSRMTKAAIIEAIEG